MAAFNYRAVDAAGRSKRGVIEASTPRGAREILRGQSLVPLSVEIATAQADGESRLRLDVLHRLRPAVGARALALITRQMSTLIESDVRIEDALRVVAQQSTSPKVKAVLLNVRARILDGRAFAQALADHPEGFPDYYRASIAAGERSGRLGAVMAHLADFVEARQRNNQKIQLALMYPSLLAAVSVTIVTLLLTFVVPDIVRVFVARGAELPLLTRGLIALSGITRSYGWIIALSVLGLLFWTRIRLETPKHRLDLHRAFALNPLTASITRQRNAAQFAGTLATLVQSGVPLLESLTAAGAVMPNLYLRAKIETATERVREGSSLQSALTDADCFPPMLVAMVASGEASGHLGLALGRAAADQQRELDAWVSTLAALVEPAVLLFMGGIVLLLVLSILLPIINLNKLAF